MESQDPFIAAEQKDRGLSRPELAPTPPGMQAIQISQSGQPVSPGQGPQGLSALRSDSSVLFKLSNLQALTPAAPRAIPAARPDDQHEMAIEEEAPAPRRRSDTGYIQIGDLSQMAFEPAVAMSACSPLGVLRPTVSVSVIPRWFWGVAAGCAALLLAVVTLCVQLARGVPEVAVAPAAEATAVAAAAKPTPALKVPAQGAPAQQLTAQASARSRASTAARPAVSKKVARARARASRRTVARASVQTRSSGGDLPAAPRHNAKAKDELDGILSGGLGGR
jgi:hypothetical protein